MHNQSGTSGNPITFDRDDLDYVSGHKAYYDWEISIGSSGRDAYDPKDGPYTEVQMRATFTDENSDEINNTVSDEFHVIIKNRCTDNELTLTGDIETLTYYVTDPEDQSVSIGHSDSVSGCTITYKLEFWDEAK